MKSKKAISLSQDSMTSIIQHVGPSKFFALVVDCISNYENDIGHVPNFSHVRSLLLDAQNEVNTPEENN